MRMDMDGASETSFAQVGGCVGGCVRVAPHSPERVRVGPFPPQRWPQLEALAAPPRQLATPRAPGPEPGLNAPACERRVVVRRDSYLRASVKS